MLKKVALVIALCYTIILATVCLVTLNSVTKVTIPYADKIFHFLAFGLFTILWFFALRLTFKFENKKVIILSFIWAVSFGIGIECLQHVMANGRSLDVYDVLANTFGALLASFLIGLKNEFNVKRV